MIKSKLCFTALGTEPAMLTSSSQIPCFIIYRFAIYIPLFLPMALPLLLSLFATIKWLRSKDGDEQSKIKQSDAGTSIITVTIRVLPPISLVLKVFLKVLIQQQHSPCGM